MTLGLPRCARSAFLVALAAATSCARPLSGTPTLAEARDVRGVVELDPGEHGAVVVTWVTPTELEEDGSLAFALRAAERALVVHPEPSAREVPFRLELPGDVGRVVPFALRDGHQQGFALLFGPRPDGPTVDTRAGDALRLRAKVRPLESEEDRCAGPRMERLVLPAPRGSAGGSSDIALCVLLPRAPSAAPLPVVYALPGLGSGHTNGSALVFRQYLDRSSAVGDAYVVGVDTRTPFGSSYLVDSPLTGPWERFVPETVVSAIDARYATIRSARGRAVIGHSTGGFDAIGLALRHPEVFGVVAASSPDALDFETWMLDASGTRAKTRWHRILAFEAALGGPGQFASYASAWSPDERGGLAWPIDLGAGTLVDSVWARWRARSPIRWLDDPDGIARARRLSGNLFLTCGRHDDADLFRPTERFHEALEVAGVEHTWLPTELHHSDLFAERFAPLFRFVMARLGSR